MKKTFLGIIASLLVAAGAQANTYTDSNPANVWLNAWNPSYTGEFTLAGYDPAVETITSASAEFSFFDLLGDESLKVNMGGDIFTHGSFSGVLNIGATVVNAWGILDSTGVLSYTVSLTSGGLSEFWLTNASLTAQTVSRSGIPDAGATSILLGLGVVTIIAARRRFTSIA